MANKLITPQGNYKDFNKFYDKFWALNKDTITEVFGADTAELKNIVKNNLKMSIVSNDYSFSEGVKAMGRTRMFLPQSEHTKQNIISALQKSKLARSAAAQMGALSSIDANSIEWDQDSQMYTFRTKYGAFWFMFGDGAYDGKTEPIFGRL